MVLTAVTVARRSSTSGQFNFLVAMLIAGFKASLVVWYFMHVKYQSHLTKLTVATGLFFLAILLGMSMIDYVSRDNFGGREALPAAVTRTGRCGQPRYALIDNQAFNRRIYTRAKRFRPSI